MTEIATLHHLIEVPAEKTLIGSVLWNNSLFHEASEFISAEDFGLDAHQRLWNRITRMLAAGNPVDVITLLNEIVKHCESDAIGGWSYVASLTEGLPQYQSVARYAKIIREKAQLRRLVSLGNRISMAAADPGAIVGELIGRTESNLLELRAENSRITDTRLSSAIVPLLDRMQAERTRTSELLGLPTGIAAFDLVTRGLQEGQNITVAARTGNGKSAFGIQTAAENAGRGTPVLIFSVEMTREDILRRVISAVSNVPFIRVRDPKWATDQDFAAIKYASDRVADWPLFVESDSSIHIDRLVARSRLAIRRDGVRLIIVDYAQIVRADGKDERLRVSSVSRGLTRLAKDTGIPVMVLSQLSRPDKSKADTRPRMSDLRESSQLENDAHVIALIHRPVDEDDHPGAETELIIAKQRAGAVGTYRLNFNRATLQFEDVRMNANTEAFAS